MKQQILIIHGGDAFDKYEDYLAFLKKKEISLEKFRHKDWKSRLGEALGPEYDVIFPEMPNKQNARYAEWKIWFEKILPLLDEKILLIGHSMGGIFLAKYLSENTCSKKILGTFLVAAPYAECELYDLGDFALQGPLSENVRQGGEVFLYFSKDDHVVPFSDLSCYTAQLPYAHERVFTDRGHFKQSDFPEIIEDIRGITA